jgi:hypothetical protein
LPNDQRELRPVQLVIAEHENLGWFWMQVEFCSVLRNCNQRDAVVISARDLLSQSLQREVMYAGMPPASPLKRWTGCQLN